MKSYKTEFYPDGFDEHGRSKGPRAFSIAYCQHNSKRFKGMTPQEKDQAVRTIEGFEKQLAITKQQIIHSQKKDA